MPRPKSEPSESPLLTERVLGDEISIARSREAKSELMELVIWDIAKLITTRNANGKRSEKFCKLCPAAKVLRVPCPHAKIWELTK